MASVHNTVECQIFLATSAAQQEHSRTQEHSDPVPYHEWGKSRSFRLS
jgi:hypothetical protein